jgi:hypothetical protein
MRDAHASVQRLGREHVREILQFALGTAPDQFAMIDRADPGGVIAAIFEALEPVEQPLRDVAPADYANDSTHLRDCS